MTINPINDSKSKQIFAQFLLLLTILTGVSFPPIGISVISASPETRTTSKFGHTTAKIAAWNLAGMDGESDARLKKQVEGLAILDAEIVALVEVKPFEYMKKLVDGLRARGCKYESKMLRQNSDLNIGVLFKEGVTANSPEFIPNSDLRDKKKRQALTVEMKVGKFEFLLIAVHLKSGRGAKEQKIRNRQCNVIGKFITNYQKENSRKAIVLLGDFNMIPGQDVSNFHYLGGNDRMDFLSSWDLQDRYSHILRKGRANLLDGFAISRTFCTQYIRGSLRLYPLHWAMGIGREVFRKSVSDHLPFVASFRID